MVLKTTPVSGNATEVSPANETQSSPSKSFASFLESAQKETGGDTPHSASTAVSAQSVGDKKTLVAGASEQPHSKQKPNEEKHPIASADTTACTVPGLQVVVPVPGAIPTSDVAKDLQSTANLEVASETESGTRVPGLTALTRTARSYQLSGVPEENVATSSTSQTRFAAQPQLAQESMSQDAGQPISHEHAELAEARKASSVALDPKPKEVAKVVSLPVPGELAKAADTSPQEDEQEITSAIEASLAQPASSAREPAQRESRVSAPESSKAHSKKSVAGELVRSSDLPPAARVTVVGNEPTVKSKATEHQPTNTTSPEIKTKEARAISESQNGEPSAAQIPAHFQGKITPVPELSSGPSNISPVPFHHDANAPQGAAASTDPSTAGGTQDAKSFSTLPTVDTPPLASPVVHNVQVLDRNGQSEMHIGLRTAAFGSVEVHAVVRDSQVGLAIGSERGDLHRLLAHEVPGMAVRLEQQDLCLNSVRFFDQGLSFNAGLASGSNSERRDFFSPRGFASNSSQSRETETLVHDPDLLSSTRTGLNVRA